MDAIWQDLVIWVVVAGAVGYVIGRVVRKYGRSKKCDKCPLLKSVENNPAHPRSPSASN